MPFGTLNDPNVPFRARPHRDAVAQWAFGDELPPTAVPWRLATEDEVGWPVGAGY